MTQMPVSGLGMSGGAASARHGPAAMVVTDGKSNRVKFLARFREKLEKQTPKKITPSSGGEISIAVSVINGSGKGQWGASVASSLRPFAVHSLRRSALVGSIESCPNASACHQGKLSALCTRQWLLNTISRVGQSVAFKAVVVWVHAGNKARALAKGRAAATPSMETGRFNGQLANQ